MAIDLAAARILISNDDGIGAPGLKILERVARGFTKDVWVVAPEREQSGASHSLTLRMPLRIRRLGPRRFAVDGTPTDCVLLAVREIMKARKPTLLLSGINSGSNIGEDVTYSGTVAAAMEGTFMGVPSIALSLAVMNDDKPRWETAAQWGRQVIERLAAAPWPRNTLMNVNFPNIDGDKVTGIEAVAQGTRNLAEAGSLLAASDPRGDRYFWIGPVAEDEQEQPGTDIHAVARGAVAVTPIHLDLTHRAALAELRRVFP